MNILKWLESISTKVTLKNDALHQPGWYICVVLSFILQLPLRHILHHYCKQLQHQAHFFSQP